MLDFFHKKSQNQQDAKSGKEEYGTAPGTQIRFDPNLISQLEADHQALLELHKEIKIYFDAGKLDVVEEKLHDFRMALQGHLLTENIRLYIYLEHMLESDETNSDLIHGFRKEMDGIAKTAMNFLKKYSEIGADPELAPGFVRDFNTIGQVLTARIEKEEKILYPLYLSEY